MYDLTIGYPDLIPQSEMDALRGVFPKSVHFHIKRQVLINCNVCYSYCNKLDIASTYLYSLFLFIAFLLLNCIVVQLLNKKEF